MTPWCSSILLFTVAYTSALANQSLAVGMKRITTSMRTMMWSRPTEHPSSYPPLPTVAASNTTKPIRPSLEPVFCCCCKKHGGLSGCKGLILILSSKKNWFLALGEIQYIPVKTINCVRVDGGTTMSPMVLWPKNVMPHYLDETVELGRMLILYPGWNWLRNRGHAPNYTWLYCLLFPKWEHNLQKNIILY